MKRRLAMLALPASLAGCGSILPAQTYAPRTDWPLDPAPPPAQPVQADDKIILVRSLTAGPGMDKRGLQTLQQNGSLHVGYYNRWAADPADAATAALAAWLAATGAFRAVVQSGSTLTPNYIVEGSFNELAADLAAGQARASITLVISAQAGLATTPVAQQLILGTAPLTGHSAPDLVAAQRAALSQALARATTAILRFA
jgi:cholesterol transport system auxiliary component